MLNTKAIKKNLDNNYNNSKITNQILSDKIVVIENSKLKELDNLVRKANEDNNLLLNNNNTDKYKDKEDSSLSNNKILSNNSDSDNTINKTINKFKKKNESLDNLKSESKSESESIKKKNINININKIKKEFEKILKNNNNNYYIIYENNKIECIISNEILLKSILNHDQNNYHIKKYLFITNWNLQFENYEFNFQNSILTNNFDIMIRIQNFIYETLINFNNLNLTDNFNYQEIIIYFYFQLIIYLFNNYNRYELSNDLSKISKIYSSLVYRFSSIILKNILKIQNLLIENTDNINKLTNIKKELFEKINYINEKNEQINNIEANIINNKKSPEIISVENKQSSETISVENKKSSETHKTESNTLSDSSKIINKESSELEISESITFKSSEGKSSEGKSSEGKSSIEEEKLNNKNRYKIKNNFSNTNLTNESDFSKNKLEKLNIKDKNGVIIKNMKDLFSEDLKINTEKSETESESESEVEFKQKQKHKSKFKSESDNYNSDDNGYYEINDTISGYSKMNNKNIPLDYINQINVTKSTVTSNSKELSYNPNSAINNSKIYKMVIN